MSSFLVPAFGRLFDVTGGSGDCSEGFPSPTFGPEVERGAGFVEVDHDPPVVVADRLELAAGDELDSGDRIELVTGHKAILAIVRHGDAGGLASAQLTPTEALTVGTALVTRALGIAASQATKALMLPAARSQVRISALALGLTQERADAVFDDELIRNAEDLERDPSQIHGIEARAHLRLVNEAAL
ncbi:MAG TPA: hypothetical protein VGJ86_23690 [Acidimicrobiales bacterium]|jgi:hypothetical protein